MRSSGINTQVLDNREYVLMKNRREELITIPKDYILSYTPKLDDVSELKIEVPNKIKHNGEEISYPLYNMLKGKRHIVIKRDNEALERFVIESIEISKEKNRRVKTVTAYSYENILKNKTCLIDEGVTRQLYKPADETFDIADGILNMFESQTGWKVAYVDEMARKEIVQSNINVTLTLSEGQTYDKVTDDMVLFDLPVNVPSEPNFALNFDISWKDLIVTTTDGSAFEAGSIIHTFVDLPTGVVNIKATFTSDSTQRYGITYDLTLEDGIVKTVTYAFVNCRDMKLQVQGNALTYITSQTEENTVTKYRFLEHSSSYWYQYLKTTIQEAYNCYIFFNSYDKTISVYDKPSRGEWKGFHLDYDNLLTKVTKTPKIESICTRLWIQSNNVDITSVNPLGTSYLEDYSYFIESGTMSEELKRGLERYYQRIEVLQEEWLTIKEQKDATDQWLTKRNAELVSLNEQVRAKNSLLTAYIKAGGNQAGQERTAKELMALEEQVITKTAAIAELQEQSDAFLAQMQLLGRQMNKEHCEDSNGLIFTPEDLEELTDITIEQTYTDDYHTKATSLYKYAQDLMKDKARLTYDFTLEHNDLIKGIKHPKGWDWFIEVGGRVEIEDKDIADADGLVTIYSFTYSPRDQKITSVDFSNNSAVIQAVNGLASIGKLLHNTAGMTDYWKSTWIEAENATAIVSDIRKNGLDLAANIVRGGGVVNKISMTEAGLFVIDAENENNQIYLGASLIAMTDDKWITSKTAVTTGGVIADTIIGRLLLGDQLFISNDEGSFTILPNGLFIKNELGDDRISIAVDENNKPYFNLGDKTDDNYLIFNPDGTLDIKASSINLTAGKIPTQEEIDKIINDAIANINVGVRNFALGTATPTVVEGTDEETVVIKLCDLSKPGSYFMDKEVTLSFEWIATEEASATFFVRTGKNHYQQLTESVIINSESTEGKVVSTQTITIGSDFEDLELVITNLKGTLAIDSLKFEIGNQVTGWTPAPEDEDASYTIMLSNEAQVISTDSNRYPLTSQTFQTEINVYRGSSTQENFTIQPLSSLNGIAPTINGNVISFEVNKNIPLEKDNGKFDIIIEIDGKTFRKVWTWAVARQGVDGIVGEDAKYVVMSGEQIFKYSDGHNGVPTPETITFETSAYGITNKTYKWEYKHSETNGWCTIPNANLDTYTLAHNDSLIFSNANIKSVQIKCTVSDIASDEISIVKLFDGSDGNDGLSIVEIKEQYYLSTSQQTLINGEWQEKAPTWEKGKYIWTRTMFIYSDGSTQTTTAICVTGKDGADGLNGGVSVSDVDVYYYQSDSPTDLVGGSWSTNAPTWESGKYVWTKTVTFLDNGTQIESSAICITGEKGEDGGQGEDGYSVILTNESHTFPCESDGTFIYDVSTYTQVIAFRGTNEVTVTVDIDAINVPSGMSVKLIDNDTTYFIIDEDTNNIADELDNKLISEGGVWIEFTALSNSTGGLLPDNGSVTIPIIIDGITFYKVFSWSKAKKGVQGETAKSADIVATSQIFKSEDGVVFTPETITLTPILQNVTFGRWQYSTNGGIRWVDVTSGINGLSIQGENLIIANNSPLFTSSITSLVFKLITSDAYIYDTITIAKLSDGNLGNIEIGIRNWLLDTGTQKTVLGSGNYAQCEKLYYLVNKDCLPLMGETITFSCDYEASAGSYGNITIETNGEYQSPAEMGYSIPLTDTVNLNQDLAGHLTKTVTVTENVSMGFTGIHLRLDNVVGSVIIKNCILTVGSVSVTWTPAPEDGINYTSGLIDELRKVDLQQIINQNQASSDRIDQILSDNIITSSEKIDLLYDFERATLDKESAISYYNTVNDTSMYNLKVTMEEAHTNLSNILTPILQDLNSDLEVTTNEIKNAFKTFYTAYEVLMTALQNSVMILVTTHATKLEQLEDSITMTATKTEIMEDKVNQVDAHMKFSVDGFVEIYATQNGQKGAFSTQITDQKLSFKENEVEVAYVSNQELHITTATIKNQMQIANFAIKPSGKGGIIFAYVGE